MIYYLEDDTNIRDLTVYALKQAGLEAAGFAHAGDFFDACRESLPDLVLLDIMLPEVDGLEVLRRLREDPATKFLPVMMLTARGGLDPHSGAVFPVRRAVVPGAGRPRRNAFAEIELRCVGICPPSLRTRVANARRLGA